MTYSDIPVWFPLPEYRFHAIMKECLEILEKTGVVPVVTLDRAEDAPRLAAALRTGGLSAAEITFRTDAAAESIARIREREPEVYVGAGTVLTKDAVREAVSAGARFIVAPGFHPAVAEAALEAGIPYIPGVMTPTEIEAAMALGLSALKFFPAEAAGGVSMLKALSAPYRSIRFMPTGGITPENLPAYLSLPSVFCCGGSFVADRKRIAAGDFDGITRTARETAALVDRIRGGDHV